MEIFEASQVVYLAIRDGMESLRELYKALNHGGLAYRECFEYHPHITIGQDLPDGEASRIAGIARERWSRYHGPCGFDVSTLSFVQNVAPSIWTDVATARLG